MPELPEVETVRAGLQRWATGRTITDVEVTHPRAVRRHVAGAADLAARLVGARFGEACRRGKYLWLPVVREAEIRGGEIPEEALVAHLGMSGQFLVREDDAPDERHLHVRIRFADGGSQLRFVDQRTFGGVMLDRLVDVDVDVDVGGGGGGGRIPAQIAHIGRDPMDPLFDDAAFVTALRKRDSAVKRALLDQSLVSGIGNIYADETLWRARVNGQRIARTLSRPVVAGVLAEVRVVLGEALRAGGTSFDALYVNVNGESGYFDRSLAVYGREGEPCPRCGTAIRRVPFMNRSSFFCPSCQRLPRVRAGSRPARGGAGPE